MRRSLAVLALLTLAGGCKNRHDRPGDTLTCTPGEVLTIGCTGMVGSVCEGDPEMFACPGEITPSGCTAANAFEVNDDSDIGNFCPLVSTSCPTSGRITIGVAGHDGASYACYWDIVHGGVQPSDASVGETF